MEKEEGGENNSGSEPSNLHRHHPPQQSRKLYLKEIKMSWYLTRRLAERLPRLANWAVQSNYLWRVILREWTNACWDFQLQSRCPKKMQRKRKKSCKAVLRIWAGSLLFFRSPVMTKLTKNDGPRNSNHSLHTHIHTHPHIADIFVRVKYFSTPESWCVQLVYVINLEIMFGEKSWLHLTNA